MLRIEGQVVAVVDKVSQKGTAYKVVKLLELGTNTRITFLQDFRGVSVQVGEQVDLEVTVRPYLTKNGKPELAFTAWAQETPAQQPLQAVVGGKYK